MARRGCRYRLVFRYDHKYSGTIIRRSCDYPDAMPEICRFFGIVVQMYYADHDPPHFHVRYSGQRALIEIETQAILRGSLSPRTLGLVAEWAMLHQRELLEDWDLARAEAQLKPIDPLE